MKKLDFRGWFFGSPLICFGQNSLKFLQDILGKKVFIVTDKFVKENLLVNVTEKLDEYGKEYEIFDEVLPDPPEEIVLKGVKVCNGYDPDLIVAVGGGSTLDTAKAIWVMYERPDLDLDDIHPFKELELGQKAKLVAIPTTSGTGAETTWAVIITRTMADGHEVKLELANRDVVPTYAILDPVFTLTLPPKLTAATGFDALGHTYEALISKFKNDFSDGMGLKAIELIREYLPIAYKDGKNMRAREALHNAASIAGLSFGNSQVIMGHALAHALGAVFHKTHGLCVGVVCPYVFQYQINDKDHTVQKEIFARVGKMLGIANWDDDDQTAAKKVIADIKALQDKVNFPKTLADLDISRESFDEKLDLVVETTLESGSGEMSIRPANADDYKKILQYAYEGKNIDW
ncbi:MAG: iron-containing alcohol dehydrogenase [Promethearchaeia archaeon]